jgi:hypothetical protein
MTRFFLALLAMLTGMAVAGQPVAARVCAEEASAAHSVDCIVAVEGADDHALAQAPSSGSPRRRAERVAMPGALSVVPPNTVRLRCDRALE